MNLAIEGRLDSFAKRAEFDLFVKLTSDLSWSTKESSCGKPLTQLGTHLGVKHWFPCNPGPEICKGFFHSEGYYVFV